MNIHFHIHIYSYLFTLAAGTARTTDPEPLMETTRKERLEMETHTHTHTHKRPEYFWSPSINQRTRYFNRENCYVPCYLLLVSPEESSVNMTTAAGLMSFLKCS